MCVCLCCCSTNERLGVSGFQVLVLWERRWVTGLMNSDGGQLLINQETVCQQADCNSSPSPYVHTHTPPHKHTQAWKYIQSAQKTMQMCPQPVYVHTNRVHISFIWVPCAVSVERGPILPFPPDSTSRSMPITCVFPPLPLEQGPSLNMERPARCKFWMRPWEQK